MIESRIMLQIIEHRKKREINLLQEVMKEMNVKQFLTEIRNNVADPTFTLFWDAFMQGFDSSSEELCKKYFDVIYGTLEELKNIQISTVHNTTIITTLAIELPKFKTNYLVKLISYCMQSIQVVNAPNATWIDLFPELLNIISSRDTVTHNDNTYTGSEYKTSIIDTLCMLEWSPNILTSLATMFIDASLTKDEHHKVANKLLQNMDSLTCSEIPSFVHNMLKFCKHIHSKYIFFKLQNYFHIRIYSLNSASRSDTNSMDLIDVAPEPSALDAEANVLFHIYQAALWSYESIKEYLNCLKSLTTVPEFILHPFQIVVLLTISKVTHYEEIVFDIIKMSLTKSYKEELKRNDSIWFSEILPQNDSITDVFERIIQFNNEEKQVYVKQGLMSLGFVFMSVSPAFGNEVIAQKHWKLGQKLLLEVLKINRNNASYIIHTLCNYIIIKEHATQYIDLLRILCRKQTIIMLENQHFLIELLESLIQISNKKGIEVLEAIGLLTKVSAIIKDQMILLLRKALFSRSIEARQIAVTGFVQILSNIKIRSVSALSLSDTSSHSGHSLLTQISASRSGRIGGDILTGESLSLEILIILKRCFMQQAEVKIHLYKGLCDVVSDNPPLAIPILELIMPHFMTYYQVDETVPLPLKYTDTIVGKDVDPVLVEPLGKLIQLICHSVIKAKLDEDENVATKFATILDGICNRMTKCNLTDYSLNDSLDLTSTNVTAIEKYLILREAMIVHNALINYKINTWTLQSNNYAKDIEMLHNNYYTIMQTAKNAKKNKRSEKRSKDKSASTSTDTTLTSKSNHFEIPPIEYNAIELTKILHLLYCNEVSWTSPEDGNILKSKNDFHRCIVQGTNNYVEFVKDNYDINGATFKTIHLNHLEKIANILYNECLVKFKNMIEFDMETSILILETFHNIMQFEFTKSHNISSFLSNICDDEENDLYVNLMKMIEMFITLYEDNDIADDADTRKLNCYCLNILSLLSLKIPNHNTALSTKVLEWLKNYCKSTCITNKQIVTSLSSLMLKLNIKFKKTTGLYANISKNLALIYGCINMTHDETEEYLLINEGTANILMPVLCTSLKTMLDDFDWLMMRLKAESTILAYENQEHISRKHDKLKQKERDICCQMCWLVDIVNILSDLQLKTQSDHLIKALVHIFVTLNSMTKYFILRSTKEDLIFEEARFDKVVKLAGKQLSRTVYNLILFLDENQIPKAGASSQSKKKINAIESKILKETKLIPKLIFEIEQFSKSVLQLSKKTHCDLTKYVGQGTSRDFRILNVEDILKNTQQNASFDDTTSDDQTNISSDRTNASEIDNVTDEEISTNSSGKRKRFS